MKKHFYIILLFCLNHLQGQSQYVDGAFAITITDTAYLNGNDGITKIQDVYGYPFKFSLNGIPNVNVGASTPIEIIAKTQTTSNCEASDGSITLLTSGGNGKIDNSFFRIGENIGTTNGVALVDLDNDGDDDLVKRRYSNCEIWINNGYGQYVQKHNIHINTRPKIMKVADFDGDSYTDILLGNVNSGIPYLQLLYNRKDSFELVFLVDSLAYHVTSMDIGDIDNDSDIDILLTGDRNPTSFLINDGKGEFTLLQDSFNTGHSAWGGILGDLDNDGDLDAVSIYFFYQLEIIENKGNNNFELKTQNVDFAINEAFLRLLDINQDSLKDIIYISKFGDVRFLINQGNLNFNSRRFDIIYTSGNQNISDVKLYDFDNDGDKDVLYVAGASKGVLENQGNGEFIRSSLVINPYSSVNFFDISDFDNDGDADLLIGGYDFTGIATNLFIGDAYAYEWNPKKSLSNTLDGLSSGIYEVTVSDVKGCTTTQQIEVFSEEPYISASITDNCPSENQLGRITVIVDGGESPYHYQWSNGDTTAQIINLKTGNYGLTVTDNQGCSAYFEGMVSDNCTDLIACSETTVTSLPTNITINQPLINSDTILALHSIRAKGTIDSQQEVVFKAGENIVLQAGFSVNSESSFLAKIEACPEEMTLETPAIKDISRKISNETIFPTMEVHPNPFVTNITVNVQTPKANLFHFMLLDLQGRVIKTSSNYFERGQHTLRFNNQDLSSGMYLLQISTQDFQKTQKIIKLQ